MRKSTLTINPVNSAFRGGADILNLNKLAAILMTNFHTLLFLIGLGVFIYGAFQSNQLFGIFSLSGSLMLVGVLSDAKPPGGR